ncbi:hypothetical protein D3C87_2114190 [compost metagenome]
MISTPLLFAGDNKVSFMISSVVRRYDPFAVATHTEYLDGIVSVTSGILGLSLHEDISTAASVQ